MIKRLSNLHKRFDFGFLSDHGFGWFLGLLSFSFNAYRNTCFSFKFMFLALLWFKYPCLVSFIFVLNVMDGVFISFFLRQKE